MPEVKIEGVRLSQQIDQYIDSLFKYGFNIVAVISDNHLSNVNGFNLLLAKYLAKQVYMTIT